MVKICYKNNLKYIFKLGSGVWSGHWGRDHYQHSPGVSELFIYSNSDYYLPAKYLEHQVLAPRVTEGVEFSAVKFQGSAHVAHLRKHKEKYKKHVRRFIKAETEEDVDTTDTRTKTKNRFIPNSESLTTSFNSP